MMNNTLTKLREESWFEFKNESGEKCTIDATLKSSEGNKGFRPMELLVGALAGCVAIDLLSILKKQRTDPSLFKITIKSKRKASVPAPFELIILELEVDEKVDTNKLDKNVSLVIDKYCSVAASLDKNIVIQHKII